MSCFWVKKGNEFMVDEIRKVSYIVSSIKFNFEMVQFVFIFYFGSFCQFVYIFEVFICKEGVVVNLQGWFLYFGYIRCQQFFCIVVFLVKKEFDFCCFCVVCVLN